MANWSSLNYYLKGVSDGVTLTWVELDAIVGGMPMSATKYNAWWYGDRPHVQSWKSAGFGFTNLQLGLQVTFVRRGLGSTLAKMESKSTRVEGVPAAENKDDSLRIAADIDSGSFANIKRRETSDEIGGANYLLKEVNENHTVVAFLEGEGLAYVGPITIERDSSGVPVEYLPQERYENRDGLRLNRHGKGPFCRFDIPKLVEDAGVYSITVDNSVVYIGECQNFRERYGPRGYGVIHPRNCFDGGQPTNCKINARVLEATLRGSIPVLWFVSEAATSRKHVEAELIARYLPSWNGRA